MARPTKEVVLGKGIPPKMRFEVFKRDAFTCQYCGRSAPDVTLEADHIKPQKEGGKNHITNLITSCKECNRGKGAKLLDDHSVLQKQRVQLEELNKRRNQLEMMMNWREELISLSEHELKIVADHFNKSTGHTLTEKGIAEFRKYLKLYGLKTILDSIDKAIIQYGKVAKDDQFTDDSVYKIYEYTIKICKFVNVDKEKPYLKDLFYIRGILRNRLNYCDQSEALILLEKAYIYGASIESLKSLALSVRNWTAFVADITDFLGCD